MQWALCFIILEHLKWVLHQNEFTLPPFFCCLDYPSVKQQPPVTPCTPDGDVSTPVQEAGNMTNPKMDPELGLSLISQTDTQWQISCGFGHFYEKWRQTSLVSCWRMEQHNICFNTDAVSWDETWLTPVMLKYVYKGTEKHLKDAEITECDAVKLTQYIAKTVVCTMVHKS